MVQGYYTLEEAAQILKMSTEELTQMAQKRQIRAFADRGTWRFRSQDVEEMARRRGQSSDELPGLGATAGESRPAKTEKHEEVFSFDVSPDSSDEIQLDKAASPASAKPGSDSDVKLVLDSDSGEIDINAEAKSAGAAAPKKKNGADGGKDTHVPEAPSDSEVHLVPLDEPDALNLGEQTTKTGSDSDIRLEEDTTTASKSARRDAMPATEEIPIDLDSELKKADQSRARPGSKSSPPAPAASPFELSDADLELPAESGASIKKKQEDTSDPDFDLSPTTGSSDEISLSEIVIDEEPAKPSGKGKGKASRPADAKSKLADSDAGAPSSSDEIEFELSLDSDADKADDKAAVAEDSSSSEFELTLDDSGGLAPLEEKGSESGETDIFETDLEVPALDEESGSEVVPLDESDTDLESSDFDFDPESSESGSAVVAIDDEADDAAKTVARKTPVKGKGKGKPVESAIADVDEILGEGGDESSAIAELEDDELAEPVAARRPVVAAGPANWGSLPAIVMLPCVLVMSLLAIMAFELLHDMWGYKQSYKPTGVLIRPIASMFAELPPDQ